ncbi:hypothetical protein [Collimonas sp.]|uniref:hypothetical protein n=1 Tax=Collimonas sp. TaxID=1963772 RepID=UPI002B566D8D|nr:hypothetical protein [Collimonas sp.]HWW04537.1 hypothetical protein [Collimonas sp.]
MKKISAVFLFSVVLSACTSMNKEPVMKGKAIEVLPMLYGTYSVKDSRLNYDKIDTVQFLPIEGKPTLKMFSNDGKKLKETTETNDCSGYRLLMNDGTTTLTVFCVNKSIGTRTAATVDLKFVEKTEKITSGSIIKAFEPMIIENGYYLMYNSGNSRMFSHFFLEKR